MATKVNTAFKKISAVTLPVLKIEKNVERYFKLMGAMHLGKKIDDKKEAATICEAIDLETGEHGLIICPMVMVNELNSAYPGESYVGKCFSVLLSIVPPKRYNIVSIAEVAEPEISEEDQAIARQKREADAAMNAAQSADVGDEPPPETPATDSPAKSAKRR